MQNISFLVLVGVLLTCAFFFSEQVRVEEDPSKATPTAIPTAESREDIPDCSRLSQNNGTSDCFQDAAAISERLVENLANQILAQEPDSAGRMAFLELQKAWMNSRDADCQFVQERSESAQQGESDRDRCLVDRNLARLDQLEVYYCDFYGDASCEASVNSLP